MEQPSGMEQPNGMEQPSEQPENIVMTKADTLKKNIRDKNEDDLKNNIYICFSNGCLVLTAYIQQKGKPGWSSVLFTANDEPMFSSTEQTSIEKTFAEAPWLLDMLTDPNTTKQKGGDPYFVGKDKEGIVSKPQEEQEPVQLSQDISLDLMLEAFLKKTQEMDSFWGEFARNSPGFAKMIDESTDIIGPYGIPIRKKSIVLLLVSLIDALRLTFALAGQKNMVLTLLVFLEELATGQWRQMILTSLGFFTPSGVAFGVIAKYFVNAWMLINPNLRDELFRDGLKGSKSVLLGFLLWGATNLPPNTVLVPIKTALEKAQKMVQGLGDKVKAFEDKASEILAPQGLVVKLPVANNLDIFKKISMDDIQNIQTLAQWDVIVCTKEFQDIIEPLMKDTVFRFILELLNIPTIREEKMKLCGAKLGQSATDVLQTSFTPIIEDIDTPKAQLEPSQPRQPSQPSQPSQNSEAAQPVQPPQNSEAAQPFQPPQPLKNSQPQPQPQPPKLSGGSRKKSKASKNSRQSRRQRGRVKTRGTL